jgi:hypothetical protein
MLSRNVDSCQGCNIVTSSIVGILRLAYPQNNVTQTFISIPKV